MKPRTQQKPRAKKTAPTGMDIVQPEPNKPLPPVAGRYKETDPQAPLPAVQPAVDPVQAYLDENDPSSFAGQLMKFSRDGQFVVTETQEEIAGDRQFLCLADETLVGWVRFHGEGEPPERHMGLLFNGFVMPPRESLGDLDPNAWDEGLDGQPKDPWQHQNMLVLQDIATDELYTFATSSVTGRRAVANLLRAYKRMAPMLPIICLGAGGFHHKDSRIGWVPVPRFVLMGKTPRDRGLSSGGEAPTRQGDLGLNDEVPF